MLWLLNTVTETIIYTVFQLDGDFRFNPAADVPHNIMSSAITTMYTLGPTYDHGTTPTSKRFSVDSLFTEVGVVYIMCTCVCLLV